jgi:hypothetical protein
MVFGLGHQVHGLEPDNQAQLGGMKDRATGERRLGMASVTLERFGFAMPYDAMAFVLAFGAPEPCRPAHLFQGFFTLGLGAIQFV